MKYKCPECNAISDSLNYRAEYQQYATEWGSYRNGDHDYGESEGGDSVDDSFEYYYECPECQAELNLEEFIEINEDEEDEPKVSRDLDNLLKQTII